ncbi:hypothetical protein [Streptomyces sp. SM12]|uniref:hypothetical protein n=1 Tax=Streptomyces sp. SM12 TaxID=1071602 RepID=UPI000CD5BE2D|nr:hypothetical protein [Streptomyces sp. SM12]
MKKTDKGAIRTLRKADGELRDYQRNSGNRSETDPTYLRLNVAAIEEATSPPTPRSRTTAAPNTPSFMENTP